MDQTAKYVQLRPEDRIGIVSMKQQGLSERAMARSLGRGPATIRRELKRNTLARLPNSSHTAQTSSSARRLVGRPPAKLDLQGVGWGAVRTMLD